MSKATCERCWSFNEIEYIRLRVIRLDIPTKNTKRICYRLNWCGIYCVSLNGLCHSPVTVIWRSDRQLPAILLCYFSSVIKVRIQRVWFCKIPHPCGWSIWLNRHSAFNPMKISHWKHRKIKNADNACNGWSWKACHLSIFVIICIQRQLYFRLFLKGTRELKLQESRSSYFFYFFRFV